MPLPRNKRGGKAAKGGGAVPPSGDPDVLKARGNDAFKAFKLDTAISLYSAAVAAAPAAAVYRSNRSAAYFEAGRYALALEDIEAALERDADDAMAAKLALRAARCAIWTADWDAGDTWLSHPALADAAAHADARAAVAAHLAACRAVEAQLAAPAAAARGRLRPGNDADAPRYIRERVQDARLEMFVTGHDDPCSMLGGAPHNSSAFPPLPHFPPPFFPPSVLHPGLGLCL